MERRFALALLLLALIAGAAQLATPGDPAFAHGVTEVDADHDGVLDPPYGPDNCGGTYQAANPTQADLDGDGLGDACDGDADGDTRDDAKDNCLGLANKDQADLDADGSGDPCDPDVDGDGAADT